MPGSWTPQHPAYPGTARPFSNIPAVADQRSQSSDMYKKFKKAKYSDQYLMRDIQPTQTWAPGSGPSSASLDGTHSPLDETIVETETGDDSFDGNAPMPNMSTPGYAVDPTALHRQLTSLSYHGASDMTGVYPPQSQQYQPPQAQAGAEGWAASEPSLAGYSSHDQAPAEPRQISTVLSRSLSDQSMSQKASRRGSVSQTAEMLGTLSMSGRDNAAFLAPTGRNSRRGSLIPPPAPLRTAGPPHLSLFDPSNATLGDSSALDREDKQPQGGWSFVPHGYMPVIFPAHVAANAEILQIIQKHGGVFPTVSQSRPAAAEESEDSQNKSATHSKESSVGTTEQEVYNLQKPRKPPRPANSFILYRRAKQDEVMKSNEGLTNNEVSRLIGQMWANETAAIKDSFKAKAEEAKRLHNITFPDYKYAPRKPLKLKKLSTVESGKKRSISEGSPDYRFPESSRQSQQTSGQASRADLTEEQRSLSPRSPGTRNAQPPYKWQAGPFNPGEGQHMYAVPYPGYLQNPTYPVYQPVLYQQAYHDMDLAAGGPAYREGRAFQYPVQQSPHSYAYPAYIPAPSHPSHEAPGMAVRAQSAPPTRLHPGIYQQPPPGLYMPSQHYQQPQQAPRPYPYSFHATPGQWQDQGGH
ncbi:hypothetical protein HDU87_006463 [Geranomyces variabilis]|uniref:HMG box domain-containing protein n=1 Tax=Geranomyces variabilis TaxID=109894 RepID=A0AAD5XKC9_9FUNG|nr:hypothetical protein HDU87_006463 [Geranomyces variabilis]